MLDIQTKIKVLQLRLLLLRVAQKDSLQWWEDESLTRSGDYLVERLFFMDQEESARMLAMEAGRTRYRMAFGDAPDKLHMFRLDPHGQVDYELRGFRLSDVEMPSDPITSNQALSHHLTALTGPAPAFEVIGLRSENCLEIRLKNYSAQTPVLVLAQALAWACLQSQPGKPCFPYILWTP